MSEDNIKLYEQWQREGSSIGFGIWCLNKGLILGMKDAVNILKLRTKGRIRGLNVDVINEKELKSNAFFRGARNEQEELDRHLTNDNPADNPLRWIIADIECASKYFSDEEKEELVQLKKELGIVDSNDC